jgi:hypothetical protein
MGGNAALTLVRAAGLGDLVRPGSEHAFAELGSQRLLPVLPELRPLLPGGGLRRGSTIGIASASVLLALLAEASQGGSWCAVVGLPTLGVAAAAELGVALDRFALVPNPGPDWPTVVAALLDGFDIVVVSASGAGTNSTAPGAVAPVVASRLAARARQRGAVLVPYGSWPSVDLTLAAVDPMWHGIEAGRGRLRGRQLTVVARGRGAASAPRVTHLWLPRPTGSTPVAGTPVPAAPEPLAKIHPLRRAAAV